MCCPVFLPFQNREDAVKLHKNTEKVALLESFSNSDINRESTSATESRHHNIIYISELLEKLKTDAYIFQTEQNKTKKTHRTYCSVNFGQVIKHYR